MGTQHLEIVRELNSTIVEKEFVLFPQEFQTSETSKLPMKTSLGTCVHLAVLKEATSHLIRGKIKGYNARLKTEAFVWVMSPDTNAFSFEACCIMCGLNASATRNIVLSEDFTHEVHEELCGIEF